MVRFTALVFSVFTFFCFTTSGFAAPQANCGCNIRPELEQIERNEVVIEGKVIAIKQIKRLRFKYIVARMQVLNAIKGTNRKYVSVQAIERQGACAVPFVLDQTMRFAARKRGASYRTNICKVFSVGDPKRL